MIQRGTDTQRSPDHSGLRNISILGDLLDDLETLRVRNGQKAGAVERLGVSTPFLVDTYGALQGIEHNVELYIKRAWRQHPLAPWQKEYRGLGEKSIARLIAVIGSPLIRTEGRWVNIEGDQYPDDPQGSVDSLVKRVWEVTGEFERSLSQLRAYCGFGAPSKRTKGMSQEDALRLGNPRAKKQVWIISTSLLKAAHGGKYPCADAYYERRALTAERLHAEDCVRCGPSGSPAKAGTPWSAAHQNADALRILGKQFLADLYDAAQELQA